MINLLDSILRRNKDGEDEDDVRIDEDHVEVQTREVNEMDEIFHRRCDYFYNRQDHDLGRVFYNLI